MECCGGRSRRALSRRRSRPARPAASRRPEARRPAAGNRRSAGAGGHRRGSRVAAGRRPNRRCATRCSGSAPATSSTCASRRFRTDRGALLRARRRRPSSRCCVGGAVRLRRPRDPATLHFFWLSVAFFGVFTFSFSGRLDRLDWIFYWADAIAILALPPLFLHFTLVFPDRPRRWTGGPHGRACVVAAYVPAFILGLARVAALARSGSDPVFFARVTAAARPFRGAVPRALLHRRAGGTDARAVDGAFDHRAPAVAVDCLGHGARRRPVCARLRPAVRDRHRPVAADGTLGDSAQPDSTRLRLGHRPVSADGHRGDRQAGARLRGGARRRRGDLRGPAAGHPAPVPRWRCRQPVGHRVPGNAGCRAAGATGEDVRPGHARPRLLPRPLRLPARPGRVRPRPEQRSRPHQPCRSPGVARRRDAARRPDGADARGRDGAALRFGPCLRFRRRPPAGNGETVSSRPASRRRPHRRARRTDRRRPLPGRGD